MPPKKQSTLNHAYISNLENHAQKYQATTITFGICYFKTQAYIKLHKHLLQMAGVLNRRVWRFFSPRSRLLSGIGKEELKLKCLFSITGAEWEQRLLLFRLRADRNQIELLKAFHFILCQTQTAMEIFHWKICTLPLICQYSPILLPQKGGRNFLIFFVKKALIKTSFGQKRNNQTETNKALLFLAFKG